MHAGMLAGPPVVRHILVDAAEGRVELPAQLALVARLGREVDDAQDRAVARRQDPLVFGNTVTCGDSSRSLPGAPDVDRAVAGTRRHHADGARWRVFDDAGNTLGVVAGQHA